MRLQELKDELLKLDLLALREIRLYSYELLKNLERSLVPGAGAGRGEEFKIGEIVKFISKAGNVIQAKISRLNSKSLSCIALDTGGKWRVGRSLVRRVETKEVSVPSFELPEDTVGQPSLGAKSSAEGAGSW